MLLSTERGILAAAEACGKCVYELEMQVPARAKDFVYRLGVFKGRVESDPEEYGEELVRLVVKWRWRKRGRWVILECDPPEVDPTTQEIGD